MSTTPPRPQDPNFQTRQHRRVDNQVVQELVLFLDIDGVLQLPSLDDSHPFELTEGVLDLLRRYPTLSVVMTAAPLDGLSLASLKAVLPPALAARVVGMTPDLPLGRSQGGKQLEIEAWLRAHPGVSRWVAVDDEELLFQPDCPNLVLTHKYIGWTPELTPTVEARLLGRPLVDYETEDVLRRPEQAEPEFTEESPGFWANAKASVLRMLGRD